ncbi:hypothetical protein [Phenylobacterium deserti]|uniref:Uncharacterized protein n=1 Tax=Phenylobacterium deserti TaxID=1914756 RepID=A0A328ASV2_9CAUL|nr:hypothetical protein [Phenylobacterium deserti]RAK57341.1 hypothetical protein DJ018_05195 [Phenylobacterium deserti]
MRGAKSNSLTAVGAALLVIGIVLSRREGNVLGMSADWFAGFLFGAAIGIFFLAIIIGVREKRAKG